MKKAGLFVISVLLISLFSFIISVSAQNESTGLEGVPLVNELQAGQQQYEQYASAENKTAYLSQEWGKILEKHAIIGPIAVQINKALRFMDPFFKIILGYESSLSWGFIFALIIWFMLFFLLSPITSGLLNNSTLGRLAAFVISSLIGLSGAIKQVISLLAPLISNIWIAIISFVVAFVLGMLFGRIGGMIKAKWQKWKEKTEKEATEQKVEILEAKEEAYEEGRPGGY